LVELLTTREPDGGSILAERLNAMGFPGRYSTGAEQPAIALGALGWLERRQLMRVLAMALLGPGSPEFFSKRRVYRAGATDHVPVPNSAAVLAAGG
jgi:hypothetical protein